jgi:hypothetical protein
LQDSYKCGQSILHRPPLTSTTPIATGTDLSQFLETHPPHQETICRLLIGCISRSIVDAVANRQTTVLSDRTIHELVYQDQCHEDGMANAFDLGVLHSV